MRKNLYAVLYLIVVEVGQTSLNREWKHFQNMYVKH